MPDGRFKDPQTRLWSAMEAMPAWWLPKDIVDLSRGRVHELIEATRSTCGVLVEGQHDDLIASLAADVSGISAGMRILGVIPQAADAEVSTFSPGLLSNPLGVSKSKLNTRRLVQAVNSEFNTGHIFEIEGAIAANVNFIPFFSVLDQRPPGVVSKASELRRLLSQTSEADWCADKIAQFRREDAVRSTSWRCRGCGRRNEASGPSPRADGATCGHWNTIYTSQGPKTFRCAGKCDYMWPAREVCASTRNVSADPIARTATHVAADAYPLLCCCVSLA